MPPPANTRLAPVLFGLALLVSLWALTRSWNQSLRDAFESRQTQTALTAYYLKQGGPVLAYETPVLGPPWSIPMEFPLYQLGAAQLSRWTGMPLEGAGRLTGVLAFYALLPAVWLFLRRRLPASQDRWLVLASVLVCPTFLFYSRAFMIESTALCLAVWFLVLLDVFLDRPRLWALLGVWLLGAAAAATKITTFAAFWIAFILLLAGHVRQRRKNGTGWTQAVAVCTGWALLAFSLPLIAGAGWVAWSDSLKRLNPYGQQLTSAALRDFNLGPLAQRFSGEWWRKMSDASLRIVAAPGLILLFLSLPLAPAYYRRLTLAALLAFFGGMLLFANLYAVHDYYFYASAGFLAVALGVASAGLLQSRLPRAISLVLISLALGLQVRAFHQTYYHFFYKVQVSAPPPVEAELVRVLTPEKEVFAGIGLDWNSLYPYYAERRGVMVYEGETKNFELLDRSLAGLAAQPATVLVAHRFRSEYPFIDDFRNRLHLSREPIARTADIDIYVRKDRARVAAKLLWAQAARPGVALNFKNDDIGLLAGETHDLATHPRAGKFPHLVPQPFQANGSHEIGVLWNEGQDVTNTHAPSEIHFHPPAGSRHITATTGMLPGSYSGGNRTSGITIMIFEEFPDGRRRFLHDRTIRPSDVPGDQGDIAIEYEQVEPFTGTLVFAHYGIGTGDFSFCWGYWKSILIR